MPCWEVRTMSVEFQAKHRKLLEQAIEALGWSWESIAGGVRVRMSSVWRDCFTINLVTQKAEVQQNQQVSLNRLKQQYSKEALKRATKLRGWQFKQPTMQLKGVLRK